MKQIVTRLCCAACALLLSATLAVAAEPAKPAAKPAAPAASKVEPAKAAEAKKGEKQEPVDINSASDAELKAIPGLGDAYIAKIVVNRPYANKAQLVSRKVIPEPVYEKIKDRIIAKQVKKDDKAVKPDPKKK